MICMHAGRDGECTDRIIKQFHHFVFLLHTLTLLAAEQRLSGKKDGPRDEARVWRIEAECTDEREAQRCCLTNCVAE